MTHEDDDLERRARIEGVLAEALRNYGKTKDEIKLLVPEFMKVIADYWISEDGKNFQPKAGLLSRIIATQSGNTKPFWGDSIARETCDQSTPEAKAALLEFEALQQKWKQEASVGA